MRRIEISEDLNTRLTALVSKIPEFDTTDEFVEFILQSTTTELERCLDTDTEDEEKPQSIDDSDAIEERLEDLGYL